MEEIEVTPEFLKIIHEKHEISRLLKQWNLMPISRYSFAKHRSWCLEKYNSLNYNIKICPELPGFCDDIFSISPDNIVLAGGACIQRYPNDYDFFFYNLEYSMPKDGYSICVGATNIINEVENLLKRKFKGVTRYETLNSVSFEFFMYGEKRKVQFIKRIYDSTDQIIGGFDLYPCQILRMSNGKFRCTEACFYAQKYACHMINLNSQSLSFKKRIRKYSRRGYTPIFLGFTGNIVKLLKCDDVTDFALGGYAQDNFINSCTSKSPCYPSKPLEYYLKLPVPWTICNAHYRLKSKLGIREFYEKFITNAYNKFSKEMKGRFLTVNPGTQFTSSFFPENKSPMEFYEGRWKKTLFVSDEFHDTLVAFSLSLHFQKFVKLPKVLRRKIELIFMKNWRDSRELPRLREEERNFPNPHLSYKMKIKGFKKIKGVWTNQKYTFKNFEEAYSEFLKMTKN